MLEGQMSAFEIIEDVKKETLQDKMKKQLTKAIKKGIVPGVKVYIDKDEKDIYVVTNLYCGSGEILETRLLSINGSLSMPWSVLSNRLTVIDEE